MGLLQAVALKHFDKDGDGILNHAEQAELDRVNSLNALPLEDFLALSREDQYAAGELWASRLIEVNVKRQDERATRLAKIDAALTLELGL